MIMRPAKRDVDNVAKEDAKRPKVNEHVLDVTEGQDEEIKQIDLLNGLAKQNEAKLMSYYTCFIGDVISCLSHEHVQTLAAVVIDTRAGTIAQVYERGHQDGSDTFLRTRAWCARDFPSAKMVVLPQNSFLFPGFYDAHIHAMSFGIRRTKGADLSACKDWDEASCLLRVRYGLHEPQSNKNQSHWIIAGGWHRAWFQEDPETTLLDTTVVRARPVYAREKDGHCVWVNTMAMEWFRRHSGEEKFEEHVREGRVRRGIMFEAAAEEVSKLLPELSQDDYNTAISFVQRSLLQRGILGYQEACLSPRQTEGYIGYYNSHVGTGRPLPLVRCLRALQHPKLADAGVVIDELRTLQAKRKHERLLVDGVKLFLDGVVEEGSAALAGGDDHVSSKHNCNVQPHDKLIWSSDDLNRLFAGFYNSSGSKPAGTGDHAPAQSHMPLRTLHLHAIGDLAVHQAVLALSHAQSSLPALPRLLDVQVAHIQLADDEDVAKLNDLHCRAVFTPQWFCEQDHRVRALLLQILGPARYARQYPWRLTRPELTCFGSDFPVSEVDPVLALNAAVRAGMPLERAFYCATQAAADACGSPGERWPRVGAPADMVLCHGEWERPEHWSVAAVFLQGVCVFSKETPKL